MLLAMSVLQVATGDGFGMFFTMVLALVVYYMVADGCANMSMYCLLVFGLVSGFESLFGLLTLFSVCSSTFRLASSLSLQVLGGRSSTTTLVKSRDSNNIVYESKISLHPFFDGSQGMLGLWGRHLLSL